MMKVNDVKWDRNDVGYIDNQTDNLIKLKNLLNETGNGFCLAKFTQVTLHLGTGTVHSCHHPTVHKIPLEEIEKDPAALFNTSHLKRVRKEMMTGGKPSECDYCWRVERGNENSDRFYKSIEPWALNQHDRIVESSPDDTYYPSYLEVDFSNVCNFRCIYCGPEYSTQWADELRRKGPVKICEGTENEMWAQGHQKNLDTLTYKNKEFNPYVDAFWKWFPEAYKHLKVYRITGGEPLLSKETFRSIDWFIENPNPNIEFNINTNLGAPEKLWKEFKEKITLLVKNRCVSRFTVFTSCDAWGERAEYLRTGLDFELWKKRYEEILQIGNIRVTTMCTFNILSVTSLVHLIDWHAEMKRKYNHNRPLIGLETGSGYKLGKHGSSIKEGIDKNPDHFAMVGIDIPYLRHPPMLDAQYMTPDLIKKYLIPLMNRVSEQTAEPTWNAHQGLEPYETERFKRLVFNILNRQKNGVAPDNHTKLNRARFYDYINEMDNRTGTNFVEVFPEMEEFYELCKKERTAIIALPKIN